MVYDVPKSAGTEAQRKEYYIKRILEAQPERSGDSQLYYGDVELEYLRLVNEGIIVDSSNTDAFVADKLKTPGTASHDAFIGQISYVSAKEFGAVGDGITDDTVALQAGIDAAKARGVAFRIHSGTFNVSDNLMFDSGVDIGGVMGGTTIKQLTPGKSVLVSRNWAMETGPSGRPYIHDLILMGEPDNPESHGMVLRDYYSKIERIRFINCGGDGLRLTSLTKAGTAVGSSLVDNVFDDLESRGCKGYGFHFGQANNSKLTDGYASRLYVSCGVGALGAIYIGAAAGWKLNTVHTYGQLVPIAVDIRNCYHTELSGIYCEANWSTAAIQLASVQQVTSLDNISISASTNSAGGRAISVYDRNGAYPSASVDIGSVMIRAFTAGVVFSAIALETGTIKVRVNSLTIDGDGASSVTRYGGFAASSIKRIEDISVDSVVRDSTNKVSLNVAGIPLALTGRTSWNGAGAKSIALNLPDIKTFRVVHGTLSIVSVNNYNGTVAARWTADLILTSKADTDAWYVNISDIIAPTGFTVVPAVVIDKATKTLTVSFEPTSTTGYGVVSMTLEYH